MLNFKVMVYQKTRNQEKCIYSGYINLGHKIFKGMKTFQDSSQI